MSMAFSQITCDKLHEMLKDGTTYQCPFCYAAKAQKELEEEKESHMETAAILRRIRDRAEKLEAKIRYWEDHEVDKALCCASNEDRCAKLEAGLSLIASMAHLHADHKLIETAAMTALKEEP
jgi:hypothetical protein